MRWQWLTRWRVDLFWVHQRRVSYELWTFWFLTLGWWGYVGWSWRGHSGEWFTGVIRVVWVQLLLGGLGCCWVALLSQLHDLLVDLDGDLLQLIGQFLSFFVTGELLATPWSFPARGINPNGVFALFLIPRPKHRNMCPTHGDTIATSISYPSVVTTGIQRPSASNIKLKAFIIILAPWCWYLGGRAWFINWRVFLVGKQLELFLQWKDFVGFWCCRGRLRCLVD